MKKSYLFFYFIIITHFVSAQKDNTIKVELKDNFLSVNYKGKERLSEGEIRFQGVNFPISDASLKNKGSESEVQFSSKGKGKVGLTVERAQNVITLSISPNKNNSKNGHDYIGFFLDIPDFRIGTSIWRYGESKAWTKPKAVDDLADLDTLNIQFFYWKYDDDMYGVAIPLGGNGYSASLGKSGEKFGSKSFILVNDHLADEIPLMAVGFGDDIYKLAEEVIEAGMIKMGYPENLRKNKRYPEIFENFGWCTWDAFGHNINEEKILEGVESFTKNNFPVPFVLIDDGWLKVGQDMKLKSLYPDSLKFPNGFKPLVEKLKSTYGVKDVGIWHTINAYWKGVDITSPLGKEYKDVLYSYPGKLPWSKDTLKTFYTPTPESEKGMRFFIDWYDYLSKEGISFIKVDNQLAVGQISNNQLPLWNTGKQLQQNFQLPARKYFNGNVINCMEMTVDNIYHFGQSAVARASDDYMPKEISYNLESGNAAVHIVNCLYNSLWLSPIVWPDYDMFESYQLYPEYHAIARAISGGPVYVSDWPNEQNFDVLRPLILSSGKILRTDNPAQLTQDCLFQIQGAKPLKAFAFVGDAGLLGVWNASNSGVVKGSFKPSDLHGINGERFVVYEHFSEDALELGLEDSVSLHLTRMDYRLFIIVPIKNEAAVVGLINKYNSSKTIENQKITAEEIEVTISEAGTLGVYLPAVPQKIEIDGRVLEKGQFTYKDKLLKIHASSPAVGKMVVKIYR